MSQTRGTAFTPSALDPAQTEQDLSLAGILGFMLRHRRLILGTGLVAFLLVGVTAFLRPRSYTSTARFMPQASDNALSRLSGIAATFGVAVPSSDAGSSPAFYADLLKSRDILRRTVESQYAFVAQGDSMRGTLIELFRTQGETPAVRRDAAAKELLENIDVRVGRETGTIPYSERMMTCAPAW